MLQGVEAESAYHSLAHLHICPGRASPKICSIVLSYHMTVIDLEIMSLPFLSVTLYYLLGLWSRSSSVFHVDLGAHSLKPQKKQNSEVSDDKACKAIEALVLFAKSAGIYDGRNRDS